MSRHIVRQMTRQSLGLEDDNPEIVVEEVVVQPEESVADTELTIVEAAKEVEETTDTVESLETAAASLESIALSIEELLEAAPADGEPGADEAGLTPEAAEMVEERVEEVTESIGLTTPEGETPEVIASVESFSGSKRRVASMEALDNVKGVLIRIWTGIKNAIVAAYNAVKNFFAELFDGVKRIKTRVAELKKVAGTIEANADAKIKFSGATKLQLAGKYDTATALHGLEETKKIGADIFGSYVDATAKLYGDLAGLAPKAAAGEATDVLAVVKAAETKINGICGREFSGGVAFQASETKAQKEGASVTGAVARVTAPYLAKAEYDTKASEIQETAALTPAEITKVLDTVAAIASLIEGKKSAVQKLDTAAADLRTKLDAAVKAAEGKGTAEKLKDRLVIQAVMRLGGKPWQKPVTQYSAQAFGVMRTALVLAERSIHAQAKKAA